MTLYDGKTPIVFEVKGRKIEIPFSEEPKKIDVKKDDETSDDSTEKKTIEPESPI